MSEPRRLPGDSVTELDPVGFAVAFTRAMRKQKTASWRPSLRTSLAIPRLLAARWMRLRTLSPRDYVEAAVLCTPLADQDLARAVAEGLLFPEADEAQVAVVEQLEDGVEAGDVMADILGDLADLDLDGLDDLADLDALLEEDQDEELGAFELFEELYSSADPVERAQGELIRAFGGPAELEASAIRTRPLLKVWLARQLLSRVGELEPEQVLHGCTAGYGPDLAQACRQPWELAGVLAAHDPAQLPAHLGDLLQSGSSRELGRTLAFLGPHPAIQGQREAFAETALARALDLSDFAELAVGLGEWLDAPEDLLEASLAVSAPRTLEAAAWLEQHFGIDLRPELFERWLKAHPQADLGLLALVAVDCKAWEQALERGLKIEIDRGVPDALQLAQTLVATEVPAGQRMARRLATEALVLVQEAPLFLPLLDAFIDREAPPHSLERVLQRARELGVPEEEVYDRLGKALEQLRQMILDEERDAHRYQRLVKRVRSMPQEMMEELCQAAGACGNLEAMAALLAVDMGEACQNLGPGQVGDALGYKGIGGGRNLLLQWFSHRQRLAPGLRAQVKTMAKAALMDEAFHWMGSGGSSDEGLVPQNRTRPFRAGDELDALDVESTLEAIIGSGKGLDQLTEEDLFAQDSSRGRAAMCVLIDISGSMSGRELASCAIAVVMLLGRLSPAEVALAVFESNTHVVKNFEDPTDLDQVADQVLDLAARGGTRVEAALSWAGEQFGSVPEAETRVLFLLSDFCFFEGEQVLRSRCELLSEHGAQMLAASHGYLSQGTLDRMLALIGGEHLEIKDLDELPALLLGCIARIGDG